MTDADRIQVEWIREYIASYQPADRYAHLVQWETALQLAKAYSAAKHPRRRMARQPKARLKDAA